MAKKRGVRIQIVVEDEALERFARETLMRFGFGRHELRVAQYPVGRGSAKDWVDQQYPIEVHRLRSKGYQNLGILIGTEADEKTVTQRANRLADALKNQNIPPRADDERIVHWIPKWNVETWMLYFSDDPRDEDHNCKTDAINVDYRAIAQAFVNEYRQFKQDRSIRTQPSLKLSYEETERLNV